MKLFKRVVVAFFWCLLYLGVIFLGIEAMAVFLFALSIIGIWEFYKAVKVKKIILRTMLSSLFALMIFACSLLFKHLDLTCFFLIMFINFILFSMINLNSLELQDSLKNIAFSTFILFYLPGLLVFNLEFLKIPYGRSILLLVLTLTWTYDTFAYFAGSWLGKRKLSAQVSPKKTFEGFILGLVLNMPVAILFTRLLKLNIQTHIIIIISVLIGLLATAGDLFESTYKRSLNIKDFSKILSEHGGVIDRVDSLLVVIPVIYFLFYFKLLVIS